MGLLLNVSTCNAKPSARAVKNMAANQESQRGPSHVISSTKSRISRRPFLLFGWCTDFGLIRLYPLMAAAGFGAMDSYR